MGDGRQAERCQDDVGEGDEKQSPFGFAPAAPEIRDPDSEEQKKNWVGLQEPYQ
jgi:hypothetical protein